MRVGPTKHHFGGGGNGSVSVPRAILGKTNQSEKEENVETPLVAFEFYCRLIFKAVICSDSIGGQQVYAVRPGRTSLNICRIK